MMRLLIALPALNEEKRIASVLESLPKKIHGIGDVRVVVIDDGSQDKTSSIAQSQNAIVVQHGRNRGVGVAFQTAVKEALKEKSDILLTFDADGQFCVDEIPSSQANP